MGDVDPAQRDSTILSEQLPQAGLYTVLTLILSLPVQQYSWTALFDRPSVKTSAIAIGTLKVLFILQAIHLAGLCIDFVFQEIKEPGIPEPPIYWLVPTVITCGIVLMVTKDAAAMSQHTFISLIAAAIPAILITEVGTMPQLFESADLHVLCIYFVSLIAIFWSDAKWLVPGSDFLLSKVQVKKSGNLAVKKSASRKFESATTITTTTSRSTSSLSTMPSDSTLRTLESNSSHDLGRRH
ncbi:uncharacterized protein LOC129590104 [Paramacrobiotus metropolitanus]|uniref:uncharacterized protein LOC129590104 n=1 Tax=Paramacrobiotus metropolitanus TaxID=2943436 RepID=UPI0024461DE8|nr:uncharacterized protein LOC129590104 [Paramacrobiotus metropolitanus]